MDENLREEYMHAANLADQINDLRSDPSLRVRFLANDLEDLLDAVMRVLDSGSMDERDSALQQLDGLMR